MPGFDGTGPMGAGPMTGRGMGPCGGYGYGGRRGGYGWRRGLGHMHHPFWGQPAVVSNDDKVEYLQDEAKALKEEMKAIEDELGRLKK